MSEKKYEMVEVEFSDQVFLELARMAHERDITFNELCNDILREQIEKIEAEAKEKGEQ